MMQTYQVSLDKFNSGTVRKAISDLETIFQAREIKIDPELILEKIRDPDTLEYLRSEISKIGLEYFICLISNQLKQTKLSTEAYSLVFILFPNFFSRNDILISSNLSILQTSINDSEELGNMISILRNAGMFEQSFYNNILKYYSQDELREIIISNRRWYDWLFQLNTMSDRIVQLKTEERQTRKQEKQREIEAVTQRRIREYEVSIQNKIIQTVELLNALMGAELTNELYVDENCLQQRILNIGVNDFLEKIFDCLERASQDSENYDAITFLELESQVIKLIINIQGSDIEFSKTFALKVFNETCVTNLMRLLDFTHFHPIELLRLKRNAKINQFFDILFFNLSSTFGTEYINIWHTMINYDRNNVLQKFIRLLRENGIENVPSTCEEVYRRFIRTFPYVENIGIDSRVNERYNILEFIFRGSGFVNRTFFEEIYSRFKSTNVFNLLYPDSKYRNPEAFSLLCPNSENQDEDDEPIDQDEHGEPIDEDDEQVFFPIENQDEGNEQASSQIVADQPLLPSAPELNDLTDNLVRKKRNMKKFLLIPASLFSVGFTITAILLSSTQKSITSGSPLQHLPLTIGTLLAIVCLIIYFCINRNIISQMNTARPHIEPRLLIEEH